MRAENSIVQVVWRRHKSSYPNRSASPEAAAHEAIRAHLTQRNEPAPYLNLHASAVMAMTQPQAAAPSASGDPGEIVGMIQNKIQQVFIRKPVCKAL
jgi:hypothetical protein